MRKPPPRPDLLWPGAIGLLLAAVAAWTYAGRLMQSAMDYRSPLRSSAPLPGDALGEPLARRVVIVLVDALRDDVSRDPQVMPFVNELRSQGASATMHSRPPSFSIPGWVTLLSGAWPDINDSQVFNPPGIDEVRPATQDNVFAAARRAGLHTAIAGYPWFRFLFPEGVVEANYNPPSGEMILTDRSVTQAAIPWLEGGEYQLVLVHYDQVDDAGHYLGGPLSESGKAAAARVDALIRDLAATLDLDLDTLIVVSDHGHIDRGGLGAHGGAEPASLVEPFVMVGAGVQAGELGDIQMVDLAPTVSVLLGLQIPAANQGHPLLAALALSGPRARQVQADLAEQQARLASAYSAAIGVPIAPPTEGDAVAVTQAAMENARSLRLWRERAWRIPLAAVALLVPAFVLQRRRSRELAWLSLIAILTLAVFYFRVAFLDRDGYNYFFSTPPWRIELFLFVGVSMGVALMLGWLGCLLGLRAIESGPRRAAEAVLAYAWMVVLPLAALLAVNFAVNGALVGWTLPEFWPMFLSLLALIQISFTAVYGLLLAGLSAGISWIVRLRT
jgi:hypothetical protein